MKNKTKVFWGEFAGIPKEILLLSKEDINDIKKLKEQQNYDEIYKKYGRNVYIKYVPKKYRKVELKKLKKEKRYFDIYNKYGESYYNKILLKAYFEENKEARGSLYAIRKDFSMRMKKFFVRSAIVGSGVLSTGAFGVHKLHEGSKQLIQSNSVEYADKINSYMEELRNYTDEVVSNNEYDDVELFMRLYQDMWEKNQYKNPDNEIQGFLELNMGINEEGYGVCRNMASDLAKKLNEINPKYNAKTLIVYKDMKSMKRANIDRKIDSTTIQTQEEQNKNHIVEVNKYIYGNHMITLVDIEKDNVTLALDPTNPSIGVYKDGKITFFNKDVNDNTITYKIRYNQEYILGTSEISDEFADYKKSFRKSNLTMEELNEKYGLEKQNKAIKKINKNKEKDEQER